MKLTKPNKCIKTSLRNPLPPAVKRCQDLENILLSQSSPVDVQSSVNRHSSDELNFFLSGHIFQPTVSGSLLFKYKHVCGKEAGKKEDCLERACWDNLVISKNLKLLHKNARYLLFSLVDPQEKHELRQKHGRCCV